MQKSSTPNSVDTILQAPTTNVGVTLVMATNAKQEQQRQVSTDHWLDRSVNELTVLGNTPHNFKAGKIADCVENWESLTTDRWILNVVRGDFMCQVTLAEVAKATRYQVSLLQNHRHSRQGGCHPDLWR